MRLIHTQSIQQVALWFSISVNHHTNTKKIEKKLRRVHPHSFVTVNTCMTLWVTFCVECDLQTSPHVLFDSPMCSAGYWSPATAKNSQSSNTEKEGGASARCWYSLMNKNVQSARIHTAKSTSTLHNCLLLFLHIDEHTIMYKNVYSLSGLRENLTDQHGCLLNTLLDSSEKKEKLLIRCVDVASLLASMYFLLCDFVLSQWGNCL